ncbi:MAG: 50S ribosomal protein L18 [Candidatus Portnoybacteria bacterium RBG_13_41_18]|uniref:Large ribosomal subunit protein uL18 n=1 Tax=Candidatus Portnoybacteria bacterium RBG_13_41_18 TaxID=1801991 RepID=A0A1G2F9B0_9BACT|nr:MAG: 50S ribosomal protein L18 [Candidatus Portnoybacteria bacterium RBG_13_41_18]
MNSKIKKEKRMVRHRRIRAKIKGTKARPRFSVFRSNQHIYAQLIDDEKSKTLISASSKDEKKTGKKGDQAKEIGKTLAKKALELKIKQVVFDRGGYKFHGRVKQLAEGARDGGLEF